MKLIGNIQIHVCAWKLMYEKLQNMYKTCVQGAVTRYGQMIKVYQSTKYIKNVSTKI